MLHCVSLIFYLLVNIYGMHWYQYTKVWFELHLFWATLFFMAHFGWMFILHHLNHQVSYHFCYEYFYLLKKSKLIICTIVSSNGHSNMTFVISVEYYILIHLVGLLLQTVVCGKLQLKLINGKQTGNDNCLGRQ